MTSPSGDSFPGLDAAQIRLCEEHLGRVPLPAQAMALLHSWAEGPGLPSEPREFLSLLYLAGTSEALTLSLLRRPSLFRALSRDTLSPAPLGSMEMNEALGRYLLHARADSPEARFASFRVLQSARILLGEILGRMTPEQATAELSAMADALIQRAFHETFQPLRERLGLPLRTGQDGRAAPCGLAVFALGKLGGGELNYASDVDLIFFYEEDGHTDKATENQRFFNAWVRDSVALLTRPTPDGPALKIDPNLRPRGRDGELTLSFPAALAYYREWADLWERQAWTRGRTCAGDLAAGSRFLKALAEVLYKPYAFSGIAFQNRETRKKAVARLRSARGEACERDVKEGPGGIRDVEFAVQALQMAYGQEDRWVREPNTPLALARLAQKGVLAETERAALARAYSLLRKAEHWAQVQGMRQSHDLPDSEESWRGLARYAGARTPRLFQGKLASARAEAARLFDVLCSRLERAASEEDAAGRLLQPASLAAALAEAGVTEATRAASLLAELYRALERHLTTPRRRNHFLRIHYSIQRELVLRPGTRAGLLALHHILPALQAEPGLLMLALDHPRIPRMVYWLAARSETLLERMQQWPHLLKRLSYREFRTLPAKIESLSGATDLDTLRRAQKEALFVAGARSLLMEESLAWVQEQLGDIAERILKRAFDLACADVEASWGLEPESLRKSVALIALGRMGTREMLPRSDLDLVAVKRNSWVLPDVPERSAALETALVRRLLDALTAVTRHGALYPVDMRLKPHGSAGPLLTTADSLGPYFRGQADSWERLAWLKARPVAGDPDLAASCTQSVRAAAFERGLDAEDLRRLDELRLRLEASDGTLEGILKFGIGGLMTADLTLLSTQIRSGVDVGPCPRAELLQRLVEAGAFRPEAALPLAAAVLFQETLLLRLRLKFLRSPDGRRAGEVLASIAEEGASGLARSALGPASKASPDLRTLWDSHRRTLAEAWERFRAAPARLA